MKILACISEDSYFLSHRKELLLGLKAAGFQLQLVTNLQEKAMETMESGIEIRAMSVNRESISPMNLFRGVFGYRRMIKSFAPDIVFAVALKPIVLATLCRYVGIGVPMLLAFTGLGSAFANNTSNIRVRGARRAMEVFFPFLVKSERCYCLFQNSDDADFFWRRGWTVTERSYMIPGAGVDLISYHPRKRSENTPLIFLFAGRLLWDKGIQELVEACRLLREKGFKFKCQIAGLIDRLSNNAVPVDFVEHSHRLEIIEWLGPRRDIAELMGAADCFVFPSIYREGVPKVLLEASAAGLPMITTNMPGCRDVVKSGFNGLIVPPKDPVKLADAMAHCIHNRSQLPIWGANARQQAELEYGIDRVIGRHVEIFKTIAERHQLPTKLQLSKKKSVRDCSLSG